MVAADARTAVTFSLSPGQAHDAPEGRKLLRRLGHQRAGPALVMDRAYEGDATRQLALDLGFTPVVPPLKTRRKPWVYDREIYKRRNEIERLFRRLKGFRRISRRCAVPGLRPVRTSPMSGRTVSAPLEHRGERVLPFKPNYSFERRQRELAKAEKKAARLEARARKPERQAAENRSGESDGQADESPPKAEEEQ